MKLSAVVIALNEEARIGDCLASLRFVDEIVVVDSGSSDKTTEIAKKSAHKVLTRPFDNFAAQKNYAASQASGDWVLSVDADERVSPALAAEIRETISSGAPFSAYAIKRRTLLFGREFRFSGLQYDKPVRLFKKNSASFEGVVHETLDVRGSTGELKEKLEHQSFQSMDEYWRRLEVYTDLEADKERRSAPFWTMLARPPARFASIYVLNQGFRDGKEGLLYAALSSYYEFLRWKKIRAKQRGI